VILRSDFANVQMLVSFDNYALSLVEAWPLQSLRCRCHTRTLRDHSSVVTETFVRSHSGKH
jgi:hypothetical protein